MIEHKKILLMGSGGIGDALFLTPAARAVRNNFPRARISLFFTGNGHLVFKRNTSVDDVIPAPFASHWSRDKPEEGLARGNYDLAIIFNRDAAYRDLAQHAGITSIWRIEDIHERIVPERPTQAQDRTGGTYVSIRRDAESEHSVAMNLDLLRAAGLAVDSTDMEMPIEPEDERAAADLLRREGVAPSDQLIAFHPGTALLNRPRMGRLIRRARLIVKGGTFVYDGRCWPVESFAQLGNLIAMTFRSRIVITGGRYEGGLAAKISRLSQFRPINLTGKTDIGQLAVILKQTRLVVAGDTGVLHLAMTMKAPVVGIYGSTHVSRTGPWGPKEQFLAVGSERHMQRITVEEVFDAVKSLLGCGAAVRSTSSVSSGSSWSS